MAAGTARTVMAKDCTDTVFDEPPQATLRASTGTSAQCVTRLMNSGTPPSRGQYRNVL